jgi:catechol 2,3-dioxygenase
VIPPDTSIGKVRLRVADIDALGEFYERVVGLRNVERDGDVTRLGPEGGEPLVELVSTPDAAGRPGFSTGLFHLAILVPDRAELARSLRRVAEHGWRLTGASDHLVSEALYLADPDGNGIEIYRDRPREQWPREGGQIRMTTDPLDVEGLLSELDRAPGAWPGMPAGTLMGHVHLRVSDTRAAEAFYRDVLGMDATTRYGPAASFMSWDGYHHHLGLNTWGSLGAPPPPAGSAGLRHFTLRPPDAARFARIERAAESHAVPTEAASGGILLRDPAGNGVVVVPPRAGD